MRPLFFMGNYLKKWIENARPRSLMQSMMPAVLATICAIGSEKFNILCGFAAILGVVCAHLALNLADDWFDYRIDIARLRAALLQPLNMSRKSRISRAYRSTSIHLSRAPSISRCLWKSATGS